jgi:hypothetical protein
MALETTTGKYYYRNESPVTAPALTMSAWAYTTSSTANQNAFVLNSQSAGSAFGLSLEGAVIGDPLNFYCFNTTVRSAQTANAFTANAWNHCCGVAASTTDRKSYLNGNTANRGTSTASEVPSAINRVSIGTYFGSTTVDSPLLGGVAECAIWNVALNEDEIVALSKGMSANRIRPQSLVFYLPGIRNVIDLKKETAITSVGSPGVIAHPRIY